MTIKDQINEDLKDCMRARDKEKLGVLRLITAAIKQVEVDERITVDDARLLTILGRMEKQRKESITQFTAGGRDDLVAQEKYELDIITHYLPEPLSEAEISQLLDEALATTHATKISDMGKVMDILRPLVQGRTDMSKLSGLVKSKLI